MHDHTWRPKAGGQHGYLNNVGRIPRRIVDSPWILVLDQKPIGSKRIRLEKTLGALWLRNNAIGVKPWKLLQLAFNSLDHFWPITNLALQKQPRIGISLGDGQSGPCCFQAWEIGLVHKQILSFGTDQLIDIDALNFVFHCVLIGVFSCFSTLDDYLLIMFS